MAHEKSVATRGDHVARRGVALWCGLEPRSVAICLALMAMLSACSASTVPVSSRRTAPRGTGTEPTITTESADPTSWSADLPAVVKAELERRVLDAEDDGRHRVQISMAPQASPQRVLVVAAHLHGTGIQLLQLELTPNGDALFTSVDAPELPAPSLAAEPPRIEPKQRPIELAEARRLLERAALAISADIQLVTPPSEGGFVLRQLKRVHDTEVLGVRLWTHAGAMIERRFDGQPGNLTESHRAPVDLIRGDLARLVASTRPSAVTPHHRAMLADAWPPIDAVPPWTYARLLALATALPSAALTPRLRSSLEQAGETSIQTINALAATTEVDLRRNESGQLRALPDIVQAYRQLLQHQRD